MFLLYPTFSFFLSHLFFLHTHTHHIIFTHLKQKYTLMRDGHETLVQNYGSCGRYLGTEIFLFCFLSCFGCKNHYYILILQYQLYKHIYIYIYIYIQYLTEESTPVTFLQIFYYIFSCDNTEEMTLCYNVK